MKSYKRMTVSEKAITRELYDAIQSGGLDFIVDVVEEGNMKAVTSNAVAKALAQYITKTGTIVVSVRNFITGELLEGIQVKVGNTTKTTDSTGICSFEDLKYGSYMIKIFADDYKPFFDSIYLDNDFYDFTAEIIPEEARYGTVNLSVIDKTTLEGVNEATVKVNNEIQTTNDQGKCSFTQVPYGSYIAQVQHQHYNDAFDSFTLNEAVFDEVVEMTSKSESKYGNINIIVYDKESSLPLPSVKVSLGSQTLITDEAGECSFTNILYGSYLLTATLNGYSIYESSILLESEELNYNINLNKLKGTINLTVVDEVTSSPLQDAQVTIDDKTQTTDADGKCSFINLDYDSYVVEIICKDYNSYRAIITLNSEVVEYTAKLTQTIQTGNVTIYVRDKDTTELLSNVSVTLNNETKETDSDGKCAFTDLVYSTYTLKAVHENYNNYIGSITVDSPETDYMIDLTPTVQKGDIYITVLNSKTSNPVSSATVTVGGVVQETDSSGECSFLNMDYNDYPVNIKHDGYNEYESTLTLDDKELNYVAKLNPISQKGTINVLVIDGSTSDPIESAIVNVGNGTQTTDAEGKCSFKDIEYGDYSVNISHESYESYETTITLDSESVDYTAQLTKEIEKGNITVSVLDEGLEYPIESATVTISDVTKQTNSTNDISKQTDSTGECSFENIPYGDYSLKIQHEKYKDYTVAITLDSEDLSVENSLTAVNSSVVTIYVKDKDTGDLVNGAVVKLHNKEQKTSTGGFALYPIVCYGTQPLIVTCDGYRNYTTELTIDDVTETYTAELVSTSTETGIINIYVFDENTNDPIESAKVVIGDMTHTTSVEGYCRFINLPYDDYTVEITCDNYNDYTDTVTLDSTRIYYTAKLTPTPKLGTVNVIVVDESTSDPIESATVKLNEETQTTDAEGKCSFSDIEYGEYLIEINHDGYYKYTDTVTVNQEINEYNAKLIEGTGKGDLYITVLDKTTESPVKQATVTVGDNIVETDDDGKCSIMELLYGDYSLEVTHDDYVIYNDIITIDSSEINYTINLTPIQKGTINITVLDETTNNPIESAIVNCGNGTQQTDAEGKCNFSNLLYNDYSVNIFHEDYESYETTITLASESVDYTAKLTPIPKKGTVNVTVVDETTSTPLESATVTINGTSESTDSDGKCSFTDLAYGTYDLSILHDNYDEYKDTITVNKEITDYTAKLTEIIETGTINVTVVDNISDTPIADAYVKISNVIESTDADGKCSFSDLAYDDYTVEITCEDYDDYSDTITLASESVDYTAKLTPTPRLGTINVTVVDTTLGTGISNASVKINNITKTTDTGGKCSFDDLEYGDYTVTITHTDYNKYTDTVTLASKEMDYTARVTATNVATVTITVLDNDTGEAVSDAIVNLGTLSDVTGTAGTCTFTNVPYNTYNLIVTCDGYASYTESLSVQRAAVTKKVNIKQAEAMIIFKGQVVDAQGVLEDVTISSETYTTISDSEGNYTLSRPVDADTKIYTLRFKKEYYKTVSFNIKTEESEYTVDTQTLVLEEYPSTCNVSGLVKNTKYNSTEYEPSANAILTFQHIETETTYNYTTGTDGLFQLENINAGNYNLLTGSDNIYKEETFSNVFYLRPEQTINSLEYVLTKLVHDFQLGVTYEDGTIVDNQKVEIYTASEELISTGLISKGTFKFIVKNDLDTDLTARVYYPDEYYVDYDIGSAKNTEANITIPPESEYESTVTVTVVNTSTKNPITNAIVDIGVHTGTTGTTGQCTLENVKYGTYDITVTHELYEEYMGSISVDASEVDYTAELTLIPVKVTFKGHVIDESGANLENVNIVIDGAQAGVTDNDGNYNITVEKISNEDKYQIIYSKEYYANCILTVPVGETEYTLDTQTLTIESYVPLSTFSGKVLTLDYETPTVYDTIPNFSFSLEHATRTETYEITTGTDGTFSQSRIIPGYYNIVVPESEDYQGETISKAIFLRPTEGISDYELIVTNLRHIYTLTVLHQSGDAAKDYNIVIHENNSTEELANVTTDENGTCTFKITNEDITIMANITMKYDSSVIVKKSLGSSTESSATITIPDEPTGNVNIVAIDDDTGAYVENASVTLGDETQTTDAKGKCTFTNLEYKTYDLVITCDNYREYQDRVTVNTSEIDLTPKLVPAILFTFEGVVLDGQGFLEDVTIYNNLSTVTATTNSKGVYEFQFISNHHDSITLTFNKVGYKSISLDVVMDKETTYYVVDTQNMEIDDYTITGTVMNCLIQNQIYQSTEYEVCKNLDFILQHVESETLYSCTTDEYGLFTQKLYAGNYNLIIKDNEEYESKTRHNVFFVRPSQTLTDLKLTITKIVHNFDLTVKYKNSGDPACNHKLEVYGDYSLLTTGITNESGLYSFNVCHDPEMYLTAKVYLLDGTTTEQFIGYSTETSYKISLSDETTGTGNINITVYDGETLSVLDSAEVTINEETQTTGTDGKCSFENMEYGYYTVNIVHVNFVKYDNVILLNSSEMESEHYLSDTGKVTVTAIDKTTLQPIKNAEITINNVTEVTDSEGKCTFSNVKCGDQTITTYCVGYEDYTSTVTVDSPEQECTLNLVSVSSHEIQVTVWYAGEDGSGLAAYRKIEIHERNQTYILASGETGNTGRFTFSINDSPVITLYATVYLWDGSTVERELGYSNITEVKINIPYPGKCKFTVKVIDVDTSEPLAGANVILGDEKSSTGTTGESTFEFYYDHYDLTVDYTDYEEYTDTVLLSAESEEYITKLIPYRGNVTVNVFDIISKEPISGATVEIGEVTATTDISGSCLLRVWYGTYDLTITKDEYIGYADTVTIDSREKNISVDLAPPIVYTFKGVVVDGQGALEGVTVSNSVSTFTTTTNAEGEYEFQINGKATDVVTLVFKKYYYITHSIDVNVEESTPLYILDTQTLKITDCSVHGAISNALVQNLVYQSTEDYEPSADLNFMLQHADPDTGVEYTLTTDENGLFNFSVWSGYYNFIVEGDSNYKPETQSNALFVRPDEVLENVKLETTRISHDFELTVIHLNGDVASNHKVEIFEVDSTDIIDGGVTNDDGIFVFDVSNETEVTLGARVYLLNGSRSESTLGSSTKTSREIIIPNEK